MLGWSQAQTAKMNLDLRFKVGTFYDGSWGTEVGTLLNSPDTFGTILDFRDAPSFNQSMLDAGWISNIMPQSENVLTYIDNQDAMTRQTSAPGGGFSYHSGGFYHSAML